MIALFLILLSTISYSQDFGNGSDGVCNFTGGLKAKSVWNCTDLFVSGLNTFPTASKVTLKVTGNVSISVGGTLSVSANGTIPGAGGMSGGVCSATPCSSPQTNATNPNGVSAEGGDAGNDGGLAASGGGGSGASYNSLGASGSVGNDGGFGTPGAGGTSSLSGYGTEAEFATDINGGSGGGAGGSGDDAAVLFAGGAGGAGGGVIQIFSKGTVDIDGTISSNGGNGSPGTAGASAAGGGGGGGSGGSIFIYSQSTVTISGNIVANPGAGGSGFGGDGSGGSGGTGRIRIDSIDGTILNSGTINPLPQIFKATALPSLSANFKSDISHNCSFKNEQSDFYPSFIFGILMSLMTMVVLRRI